LHAPQVVSKWSDDSDQETPIPIAKKARGTAILFFHPKEKYGSSMNLVESPILI